MLDDPARVHDVRVVGALGDHAEVVRDQDDRHPQPVLQAVDEVEDLGLDGDVQRGGRLVGDQQPGLVGQRHRDHDPLAQAAGQLVRVVVEALGWPGHADQRQHLGGPLQARPCGLRPCAAARSRRSAGRSASSGRVRSSGPGRPSRCRRRGPCASPLFDSCTRSRPSSSTCPALMRPPGGSSRMTEVPEHGLAAAGLADQAERLALGDGEADAVDRVHRRVAQPDLGAAGP